MSFYKTVLEHAPKYLTGSVFSALVGVLMTKYYTMTFSPSEFGVLALYLLMIQYITTIVGLNMPSGSARLYFDYKGASLDGYVSTVFWLISSIAVFMIIVSFVLMDMIVEWIEPGTADIYIVTLFVGVFSVYVGFFTRILYNESLSGFVLRSSILQTILNHGLSVVAISLFSLGILGRQLGQLVAYVTTCILLAYLLKALGLAKIKLFFSIFMAKETLRLCLPGVVLTLQTLLFVYLDRIFLKHFNGDADVGIYSLGFILGNGLSLVYGAIFSALYPKVITSMQGDFENSKQELERFAYSYFGFLAVLTTVLCLGSDLIVSILSTEEYAEAATVMPYIMAGFMFGGVYKIPSVILSFFKVVWVYPIFGGIAFGLNGLFNYFLIPPYGMLGAGMATFIGVYLMSMLLHFSAWPHMSKRYNLNVLFGHLFVGVITVFAFSVQTGITKLNFFN